MIPILVTGSNGQLGNELRCIAGNYPAYGFLFTDVNELDITNATEVLFFFNQYKPSFCINCAAYTAVDKAESDMEKAFLLNADAAANLANAASKFKTKLIHISTDFVFDGRKSKPYLEDDLTAPLNIYGKSKLRGEEMCLTENHETLILRTSWLYSPFGNNFVKTMQRLGKEKTEIGVIYDQVGTPTYAHDLANAIMEIITGKHSDTSGIFHFSNEGICSWYDFAVAVMTLSDLNCRVKPIETMDYPTPAKRGHFTVMNKKKIKEAFGISIPHWQESLKKCIERIDYDKTN